MKTMKTMKNDNNNQTMLENALTLEHVLYQAFQKGWEMRHIDELIDSNLPGDTPNRQLWHDYAKMVQAYVEQGLPFDAVVDDAIAERKRLNKVSQERHMLFEGMA
jgi:hypothetical protein